MVDAKRKSHESHGIYGFPCAFSAGSSPALSTGAGRHSGNVSMSVITIFSFLRASACLLRGVVQMVERQILDLKVTGSNPVALAASQAVQT